MRFENLGYHREQAFFQRLHRKLNKELFDGKLSDLEIDIRNINGYRDEDAFACYHHHSILFSHEFFEYVVKQETQKKQAECIVQVLVHEMIHQYCHENGIDDSNHSEEWQRAAEEHGLHSVYHDGVMVEERGKTILALIAADVRIR